MKILARTLHGRLHYGWIVVGLTFATLLLAGASRSAIGVFILPFEETFGWDRATISAAVSVNLLLYGLIGPFAGALMQKIGVRRTILIALSTVTVGIALTTQMTSALHLVLLWGVVVGIGTGTTALVLGATVVNRWFKERRGLALGLLTASAATGQLLFLPLLATIVAHEGWRTAVLTLAGSAALVIPLVAILFHDRPSDVGLNLYGSTSAAPAEIPTTANPITTAFSTLVMASKSGDFWLLFLSFFVCGATTNGLIGTHMIPACADHGIPEVQAAGLLAVMGIFDFFGTVGAGWMSDRWNNRTLLFWYYALRGLSLLYLPFAFDISIFGLPLFAIFYGLDWVATVPPTIRLTTDVFGRERGPIVFGWVFAGHQIGAAVAALAAGLTRQETGSYMPAFIVGGLICMIGAGLILRVGRSPRPALA